METEWESSPFQPIALLNQFIPHVFGLMIVPVFCVLRHPIWLLKEDTVCFWEVQLFPSLPLVPTAVANTSSKRVVGRQDGLCLSGPGFPIELHFALSLNSRHCPEWASESEQYRPPGGN